MSDQSIAASFAEVVLTNDGRISVDAMHKSGTSAGRFMPAQIIFADAKVKRPISSYPGFEEVIVVLEGLRQRLEELDPPASTA